MTRQRAQVGNRLFHVVRHNPFVTGDRCIVQRHQHRLPRRRSTGGDFHRTTVRCPIANHSADIANHAADRHRDRAVAPFVHQPGHPCRGTHRGGRCRAQRGQTRKLMMYIDRAQMGKHQRTCQLLFVCAKVLSHHHHRYRGGDPLIAGAGVTHGGQRRAAHTRIRRRAGPDKDRRRKIVCQQTACTLLFQRCTNVQSPVSP